MRGDDVRFIAAGALRGYRTPNAPNTNNTPSKERDTNAAVESALAAATEAVEVHTTLSDRATNTRTPATAEQLKELSTTLSIAIAAAEGSISDAKERITALESLRTGGKENLSGLYTLIGVLVIVAMLDLGVLNNLNRHNVIEAGRRCCSLASAASRLMIPRCSPTGMSTLCTCVVIPLRSTLPQRGDRWVAVRARSCFLLVGSG